MGQINRQTVPVPKYYMILNVVRQSLAKLAPGDQIPSEGELARKFDVGRVTVQRALSHLVDEGLIVRKQGKGTFYIGHGKTQQLHEISGALESIMVFEKGERATVVEKLITSDIPNDVRQILQLKPGSEAVFIKRIVTVATGPIIFLHNFLPLEFGKGIFGEDESLATSPILYLLRAKYGVLVGRAEQTIDAVLAEPDVAGALGIPIGSPSLRIERIYYKDTDIPVQFTRCWYPSGRYKYKVAFNYRGYGNER
jgi:GntR family transcriptional regulator